MSFNEREQAFEKKAAMDAEKQFKVMARRKRMLASWATTLMGYDEAQTLGYVKDIIASNFKEAGDENLLKKIHGDLQAAGQDISEQEVRVKMEELLAEARAAIGGEDE